MFAQRLSMSRFICCRWPASIDVINKFHIFILQVAIIWERQLHRNENKFCYWNERARLIFFVTKARRFSPFPLLSY